MKGGLIVNKQSINEADIDSVIFYEPKLSSSGTYVDSRDGNAYKWIKIGNQTWQAENLKYFNSISSNQQTSTSTPHYYVYDFDGSDINPVPTLDKFKKYGILYNIPAALNACPAGWHLPTKSEWLQLINFSGGDSLAGSKLKIFGTDYWKSPNMAASNLSGFSALPGGKLTRGSLGFIGYYFDHINTNGYWLGYPNFQIQLNYNSSSVIYNETTAYEQAISIRCIKDENLPVVITEFFNDVTYSTAIIGGYIHSAGGSPLTTRGICYSTNENPTINDYTITNFHGTGKFSVLISNLNQNTTYFFRSYATNSYGTSYGENISLTTLKPNLEINFLNDLDTVFVSSGTSDTVSGTIISDLGIKSIEAYRITSVSKMTIENRFVFDITKLYQFQYAINNINENTTIELTANDNNNQITSKSLTFKVISGIGASINSISNILLGAQYSTIGHAYSTISNTVYKQIQAEANSPSVDFVYYYSATNLTTLAAPNDATVNGGSGNLSICNNYSTKNSTKFSVSSVNVAEFTAMTDDTVIATISASDSKITQLAVNSVVAFITASGKKGLIHIAEITTGSTGSIKLNLKVQK